MGLAAFPTALVSFWTLITTLFFTIATAAFGAIIPIDDVEAAWNNEHTTESDIATANVIIPRIVFTPCPSADIPSFTTSFAPRPSSTSPLTRRSRMISPTDTMASNLWRAHVEYGAFVPPVAPKHALSLVTRFGSSSQNPLFSGDNSDASELPYLSTDHVESRTDSPSSTGGSSLDSSFDSALLAAALFDDSDSDDESSVESFNSQLSVFSPTPKMPRSSSRPLLQLQIGSTSENVEPSTPSPVDSGYGSRPDTPFIDKDTESKALEAASFRVEESSFISTENIPADASLADVTSSLKLFHHVAPVKSAATQGPILPQIVLFDEEGRVIDAAIDDQRADFFKSIVFNAEDVDSPYGGLMPISEVEHLAPCAIAPHVPGNVSTKRSAAGADLDRAFLSLTGPRSQLAHSVTSVYPNCSRASTVALYCIGEEEEEDVDVEEVAMELRAEEFAGTESADCEGDKQLIVLTTKEQDSVCLPVRNI
jgi:hypothetical protein